MDVKVLEKTKDGLEVAVLPYNTPAFLPTPHLSDHVANGPLLYHWLQTGDTLHRVLCLSQSEGRVVSFTGIWRAVGPWGKTLGQALFRTGSSMGKSQSFDFRSTSIK